MKRVPALLFIFLFLATIFTPLVTTFTSRLATTGVQEKRRLAEFPPFPSSRKELTAWPRRVERFLSDHFGLRLALVEGWNLLKFRLGDSPSSHVTIGRDGWLFFGGISDRYGFYNNPIGGWRGTNRFSPQQLQEFVGVLEKMQQMLAVEGVPFLYVMAPNKHTAYAEYLPPYLHRERVERAPEQLFAALKKAGIETLDLRPVIAAAKKRERRELYYKTDTHWNHLGAVVGARALAERVEQLVPGRVGPEPVFHWQHKAKHGDLAVMSGVSRFLPKDDYWQPVFADGRLPCPKVFLVPHGTARNETAADYVHVLMYRDSFSDQMAPFLLRRFGETSFLWHYPDLTDLLEEVRRIDAEIVLWEMVERDLPFRASKVKGWR